MKKIKEKLAWAVVGGAGCAIMAIPTAFFEFLSGEGSNAIYTIVFAIVAGGLLAFYISFFPPKNKNESSSDPNGDITGKSKRTNDADAYYHRGNAHYDSGNLERAIAEYNKAIELDPDFAEACFNRGLVYHDSGDLEQAIADFERYLEFAPNAPDREEVINRMEQLESEVAQSRGYKVRTDNPLFIIIILVIVFGTCFGSIIGPFQGGGGALLLIGAGVGALVAGSLCAIAYFLGGTYEGSRKRGKPLSLILLFFIFVSVGYVVFYTTAITFWILSPHKDFAARISGLFDDRPVAAEFLTIALYAFQFIFAFAAWKWKKWGYLGLITTITLISIIEISFNSAPYYLIIPAIVVAILVRQRWRMCE